MGHVQEIDMVCVSRLYLSILQTKLKFKNLNVVSKVMARTFLLS